MVSGLHLFALLIISGVCFPQENNVCRTFANYYTNMQENENCYHNPDFNLTIPEIVQRHGYVIKQYQVSTEDGYILTVFRILSGKNSSDLHPGPPVFLQHGIAHNSGGFVLRGPKSLGFILADAGYDVWLGNFRGSSYAGHKHLTKSSKQYWDFSFHEMGTYDLPAQLGLVWETTKKKIIYIGFSMGSSSAYIYGITYPEAAFEKLKIIISLAPIAFMDNIKSIVKNITPFWKYIEAVIDLQTYGRISLADSLLTKDMCTPFPFQMQLCEFLPNIFFGFNYDQDDPETLPITQQKLKDDASLKTLSHYVQLIVTGKFQSFDYGLANNLMKYGSTVPPPYDLSKMKVDNYLIRADNDLMATKENVEKLYANLPQAVRGHGIYTVPYKKFAHTGFLLAKDVVPLVYDNIISFLHNLK